MFRLCSALLPGCLASGSGWAGESLAPETLGHLKDATVFVKVSKGGTTCTGSGFLIRADGDIASVVTNRVGMP